MLLRREGWQVNIKKTRRTYNELGLQLRNKHPKRRVKAKLRGKLRDLANERRRFGYRRLFILLRREGEPSGINRIYRLYRARDPRFAWRQSPTRRSPVVGWHVS